MEVKRPGKGAATSSGKKSQSAKNKFNKIGFTEELVDDDIEEDIQTDREKDSNLLGGNIESSLGH